MYSSWKLVAEILHTTELFFSCWGVLFYFQRLMSSEFWKMRGTISFWLTKDFIDYRFKRWAHHHFISPSHNSRNLFGGTGFQPCNRKPTVDGNMWRDEMLPPPPRKLTVHPWKSVVTWLEDVIPVETETFVHSRGSSHLIRGILSWNHGFYQPV